MLRKLILPALLSLMIGTLPARAQQPTAEKDKSAAPKAADSSSAKQGTVETRVEQYLRNLYAWGPAFEVKIGTPKPTPISDLLEVPVTVTLDGQSNEAEVYVSKAGTYMIRGDLTDMTADPFADNRSKLHIGNSPSMGPVDAKITLIEFGDFECPSCRQLDLILRDLLPKHPEIRLVFKHFPLTNIHPWAMTAAIASQCAYQQNPTAFWKIHDAIYDAQDVISPENVWDKMQDLAKQEELNVETFKTCMSNPETANQVNQTIEEGHALTITATPTTFINARRVVGPDKSLIEQHITYNQHHD
jgi:protein-disulfide isomerase